MATASAPRARRPSGPPVLRHFVAVVLSIVLIALFWQVQGDIHPVHRWNRSLADASLALLCLILLLGPVSRFAPVVRKALPYRRELGVAMFATAALHVVIYLDGVYDWDPFEFFVLRGESGTAFELNRGAGAGANWVGLLAAVYLVALTATSNHFAQTRLGRGWKFLQQQSYTLFVLAAVHVAGWLYLGYRTPVRFRWWFWPMVATVVAVQLTGYAKTVRSSKGRSRGRVPDAARATQSRETEGAAR